MGFYVLHPFTGSDGAPWDATVFPTVRNARNPVGALPTIQANRGRMAMDAGDYRHVAFLAPDLADFDLKVKVRFVTPTSPPNMYPEIGYRIAGNITSGQPGPGYMLSMIPHAQGVRCLNASTFDVYAYRNDVPMADALERYFRVRVKGTTHQYKWWLVGDPEPPSFGMSFTEATFTDPGRIMLSCWNNDAAEACTIEWDDLRVEEILPPEPGVHVADSALSAIYGGDRAVVAAYLGDQSLPVPA